MIELPYSIQYIASKQRSAKSWSWFQRAIGTWTFSVFALVPGLTPEIRRVPMTALWTPPEMVVLMQAPARLSWCSHEMITL